MSYLTAKETITKLVDARILLMRNDRLFNGLTFQKVEDIQTAIKKVDSPLAFAHFLTEFWPSINLLPHILDWDQRDSLNIMLEKSKTLIEASHTHTN